MKSECLFCQIIAKERDAGIVFEDENSMAFVDPRQSNVGHVLVVPKVHVEKIYRMTADSTRGLMEALVSASQAVQRCIEPEGMSIWQSNGRAGGQEIPHVHFHVLPRYADDNHLRIYPQTPQKFSIAERRELAAKLRDTLEL